MSGDEGLLATDNRALESRIEALESELAGILDRNRRVEANKAWETSKARLFALTGITYVTMTLVFVVLGSARPFLDALVPTTGFFLSTLSLSFLRASWEAQVKARSSARGKDDQAG
jgi:hypothetical protein